eukprot:856877-Prymnesium_polylepis.1
MLRNTAAGTAAPMTAGTTWRSRTGEDHREARSLDQRAARSFERMSNAPPLRPKVESPWSSHIALPVRRNVRRA